MTRTRGRVIGAGLALGLAVSAVAAQDAGKEIKGVQRPGAPLAMPPKGGNPALTENDLRAVLGFLRRAFDARPKLPTGEQ